MAKQKLRESITLSKAQARVRESLSAEDKAELVESIVAANNGKSVDAKKLRESAESLVNASVGKNRWSFPVSRYNFINANRRRYSEAVWHKVIGEQKDIWEGCVGLADHPAGSSDPSFKDSAVVWSNLRMDEANNLVWADAIFVGEHGKLAEDILESGGRVGFSTAGMGDLVKVTEQTSTGLMEFYDVVPEEFILERVADVVPNPSQDVFGFADMKIKEANQSIIRVPYEERLAMRQGLLAGTTNPEEVFDALAINYKVPAADAREFVNRLAADTDFAPLKESGHEDEVPHKDAGVAQKMHPATDERLPTNPHNDPPLEGEEANIPEDPLDHGDYEKPKYDPVEQGDTSLRENEGGGDAGAMAGVSSEGFQGAAPENATKVTSPGRKKKDEEDYTNTGSEGKAQMESRKKPTLTSYEQRRAYEDITRFIDNANNLSNPYEKLHELREIQKYLQDVDIKELHQEVGAHIKNVDKEISALMESGLEFRNIFGTDISAKDVQGALSNLNSVKGNLKEASYDWKNVSTKLAGQLKKFVEAVHILKDRPTIEAYEKMQERHEAMRESLRAQMTRQKKKANEKFNTLEKDLTKAHNALRNSIKESKKKEAEYREQLSKLRAENRKIREQAQRLKESARAQTKELMGEETRYLFEGSKGAENRASNYRASNRKITESANGKFISETKQEVQEYFDSLLRKHGSAILPHSQDILEARNYQDAVARYMKIVDSKTQVSPDTLLDMDNPMIYEALQEGYRL